MVNAQFALTMKLSYTSIIHMKFLIFSGQYMAITYNCAIWLVLNCVKYHFQRNVKLELQKIETRNSIKTSHKSHITIQNYYLFILFFYLVPTDKLRTLYKGMFIILKLLFSKMHFACFWCFQRDIFSR